MKTPKFEKDGKVPSISFLMERVSTSPNMLSIWPERKNKSPDRVVLSAEGRLKEDEEW